VTQLILLTNYYKRNTIKDLLNVLSFSNFVSLVYIAYD